MKRSGLIRSIVIGVCAAALLAGCQQKAEGQQPESQQQTEGQQQVAQVDAVSSASKVFYQDASFDHDRLWEAIGAFEGSCTIATVNEDGTPDLIVAVPGTAGDSHLYFNWADNTTKANIQRTGVAVISYYCYNPDAEDKMERNQGARIRVSLETDQAVLEKLQQENPSCSEVSTVLKVEELLPIG